MANTVRTDVSGLPVVCESQEALDHFNRGLLALVTLSEPPVPSFKRAVELEPTFVLGSAMLGFMLLYDLNPPTDPRVAALLGVVGQADALPEREKAYVRTFQLYASGDLMAATEPLTTLLINCPLDAMSMRMLHACFLLLGEFERLRDTLAFVLTSWSEDMDLYPNVAALYAFAVEECNECDRAEKILRRVLDLKKETPFAYHAMSHVLEESKEAEEGIEFLTRSRSLWSSSIYEGHITWHLTLYYLELGDLESVYREYDTVLHGKVRPDNYFGLLDASSLLWRLDVMGVDPGEERWKKVTDAMVAREDNHRSSWFSAHVMMSFARGKVSEAAARLALAEGMITSMKRYCEDQEAFGQKTCEMLGVPVCNALLAFGKERYDEVLQIMLPLRYSLQNVGGSWAQRQIFNSTMIEAAMRAKQLPVAVGLVAELSARKPRNKRLKLLLEHLQEKIKSANGEDCDKETPAKRPKLES